MKIWGSFFVLIVLAFLTYHVLESHESASYTLSVKDNVVTIDCGEFLSAYEPMEFRVPLHMLGLSPNSVKEVRTSCKCAIGEIGPEDKEISVTYRPSPSTVRVSQHLILIPHDSSISRKLIRLTGKLIPAWFARPSAIVLDNLYPGEKRLFSTNVEINHEMREIGIKSIHLTPKTDTCLLETQLTDKTKFSIKGTVDGLPQAHTFRGNIVVTYTTGPFKVFELPLEIRHTGTISAIPEVVTLQNNQDSTSIVEFTHFADLPLYIEKIDCPEYLKVSSLRSGENKCLLKIEFKKGLFSQNQITTSKVEVAFSGIDHPGQVRIVVVPAQISSSEVLGPIDIGASLNKPRLRSMLPWAKSLETVPQRPKQSPWPDCKNKSAAFAVAEPTARIG
ncbi:MAG: hypothetical protein ACYSTF_06985 [Planctomycetota bacterium]|jgi:hypothetical protein